MPSPRVQSYQQFRDSIPADQWCNRHGPVTRYHGCPVSWPEAYGEVIDTTKGVPNE